MSTVRCPRSGKQAGSIRVVEDQRADSPSLSQSVSQSVRPPGGFDKVLADKFETAVWPSPGQASLAVSPLSDR